VHGSEIIQLRRRAQGRSDTVSPSEHLFGQFAANTARGTCDEPGCRHLSSFLYTPCPCGVRPSLKGCPIAYREALSSQGCHFHSTPHLICTRWCCKMPLLERFPLLISPPNEAPVLTLGPKTCSSSRHLPLPQAAPEHHMVFENGQRGPAIEVPLDRFNAVHLSFDDALSSTHIPAPRLPRHNRAEGASAKPSRSSKQAFSASSNQLSRARRSC
jgi:hypothetical protein